MSERKKILASDYPELFRGLELAYVKLKRQAEETRSRREAEQQRRAAIKEEARACYATARFADRRIDFIRFARMRRDHRMIETTRRRRQRDQALARLAEIRVEIGAAAFDRALANFRRADKAARTRKRRAFWRMLDNHATPTEESQ